MTIATHGTMAVDWEQRIDFDRLRRERLDRVKSKLAKSNMGAVLCFDMTNVRYITSTHIGTWAQDKVSRWTLLPQGGEPILWDFGSAAKHHALYAPWMDGDARSRAGIPLLRGAMTPNMMRAEETADKIVRELEKHGLMKEPVGVDLVEPPVMFALQERGVKVVDGQWLMQDSRVIKTQDEISLLAHAAGMVDAVYDKIYEALRPGVRENDLVGLAAKFLYEHGSEYVEGVNAISGERCSPHPHVFSDRAHRPGDPAYFDILHSYMGYRTCYYRTFAVGSASQEMLDAYKRCRDHLDQAIAMIKPGVTTGEVASLWPKAEEFGFPNEEAAFGLQYGHGIGLAIWERPVISRLVSIDHPEVIQEGMVFALETFWPAKGGHQAARIEEEMVVTKDGCEVISKFPAEDLLVCGRQYWSGHEMLPGIRHSESHYNNRRVFPDGVNTISPQFGNTWED